MIRRVFVDTNFIIDLIARPEFSGIASEALAKGREQKIKFYICFLSLANYAYIDRKQKKEKLFENLRLLSSVFEVIPNDRNDIERAIELSPKDYEDALQYVSALKGKCDCIITRNKKDFTEISRLPVLTPEDFLEQLI